MGSRWCSTVSRSTVSRSTVSRSTVSRSTVSRSAVSRSTVWLVVSVMVAAGCASTENDDAVGADPGGFWSSATDENAPVGVARDGHPHVTVTTAPSGRFSVRVQRGVVGVAELDVTTLGSFDGRGGSEVVLDLEALAAPLVADPALDWPAEGPSRVVLRQVDGQLFVHTGVEPLPWLALGDGPDPTGAVEMASTFDPSRLAGVVERAGIDVGVHDGGAVDGVATERRSGWLGGSALVDLDDGTGRLTALAGVAPHELIDRLFRFDLWVGRDDGVARRLVLEWDLDALAELARRVDGTDEGIDRIRYRTEVRWFDLGADLRIEAPPRHLVGVIDPSARRR
jgi:hypothetical protein